MPLKIKLRKFIKQIMCSHKDYSGKCIDTINQSFVIFECKNCGKSWVEEV